VSLELSAVAGS